jgi:hypothetical protein
MVHAGQGNTNKALIKLIGLMEFIEFVELVELLVRK